MSYIDLAWILVAYLFFAAMVFGVRVRRRDRLIRAMAERIDIQSQLLSGNAEKRIDHGDAGNRRRIAPSSRDPKANAAPGCTGCGDMNNHRSGYCPSVMPPVDVSSC